MRPREPFPKPVKPEPYGHAVQRRDAEIAETSAEKTEQGGRKAKCAKSALFAEHDPGFLCAYLCDLCVSALKRFPVWFRLRRLRESHFASVWGKRRTSKVADGEVDALSAEGLGLVEHAVGFADPRGITEIDLEVAGALHGETRTKRSGGFNAETQRPQR